MSNYNKYKKELESSIKKCANKDKEVDWDAFVKECNTLIISSYNDETLAKFKGEWKRAFKMVVEEMGYTISQKSGEADMWKAVEDEVKKNNNRELQKSSAKSSPSSATASTRASNNNSARTSNNTSARTYTDSSSSSSKKVNYLVDPEEKQKVLDQYEKQKDEDKWKLSSGKVVEDMMKAAVIASRYEHPCFSFIIDPSDPVWAKYFNEDELNEIRNHRGIKVPKIVAELDELLTSFEQANLKTAEDYYNFAMAENPGLKQYERRWIRESFAAIAHLFTKADTLQLHDFSEADLLHRVWQFIYKCFDGDDVEAKLGERSCVANSLGRNIYRSLESEQKRVTKKTGAKVDILFKEGVHELGCAEVGKEDVTTADNKYLDDGMYKQPKVLRDILSSLVSVNPDKINDLYSVGFLVMGLKLELVIVDVPVGNLITRVTKTEKYKFPDHISNIAIDFLPLLEVTWIGKEMMRNATKIINNRKRRAITMSKSVENSNYFGIPPAFCRRSEGKE